MTLTYITMKMSFIFPLILGLLIISGCSTQKDNNDEIIEINITQAQENKMDLK